MPWRRKLTQDLARGALTRRTHGVPWPALIARNVRRADSTPRHDHPRGGIPMAGLFDRRGFIKGAGAAAGAIVAAPLISRTRAADAAERLVVAVGQWGIETPFAWRTTQSEKPLWDCIYDPLITRDAKTFE